MSAADSSMYMTIHRHHHHAPIGRTLTLSRYNELDKTVGYLHAPHTAHAPDPAHDTPAQKH